MILNRTALLFLPVLVFQLLAHRAARAELSAREIKLGSSIQANVRGAEQDYFEGKYESAGTNLRRAMRNLATAFETENAEFYDALQKLTQRINKTHLMLELEGVSLPPFSIPPRPAGGASPGPAAPTPGTPTTPAPATTVSFTEDVAPILLSKCGRCHVRESRGQFSAASYAALMKGPPEGLVVFAGDTIGSRLIETIETGDMPRGGAKVSPDELKTLKDWIMQGATFDGADPNATLSDGSTVPAPAARPTPPPVTRATGRETVSFSSDIAPLLVENCKGCHLDAMQVRGGLRLDTFAQLMRGGDSGPIIVPGRGQSSLLVKKLRGTATDGERMPAGGRPALSEDAIALVTKWIDEGASIDADERKPIQVISKLAWAADASSSAMTANRAYQAAANLRLAGSTATSETTTDHFRVVGSGSQATLELVGRLAEQQMKSARAIARRGGGPEDYFNGRATIFVMPKRYDYSEFAKMVEQRGIPADWFSHWQFDGIDAYICVVATDTDDEETIETRLLSPIVSLAIATRGDAPRWFSEGIGSAIAMQHNAKSREDKEKLLAAAIEAAASVKDAKAFLENRLTPVQTDSFAAALAMSMLERSRRRSLESCLRSLADGKSFEDAFFAGFGVPPAGYINAFLRYVR